MLDFLEILASFAGIFVQTISAASPNSTILLNSRVNRDNLRRYIQSRVVNQFKLAISIDEEARS